jgi:hypothetical protein
MSMAELIDKLVKGGVVERRRGILRFTTRFAGYLIWTAGTCQILETTMALSDWRSILALFDASLESLSLDEIRDVVSLFHYYLYNPETATVEQ